MPQLAAAAPYIGLIMSGVQASNQMQAGEAAQNNAKVLAIQDERDANAAQVQSQAEAALERRKERFTRSRALAVAGASGAGVDDKSVSDILTGIETQGEMNALTRLYGGDIEAQALRAHARAQRAEGSAFRGNAYGQAGATAFNGLLSYGPDVASGIKTFYQKYAGDRAQRMGTRDATSIPEWAD